MANKKAANHAGSLTKKVEKRKEKEYIYWRVRYSLPDGTRKEKIFEKQSEAQSFLNQGYFALYAEKARLKVLILKSGFRFSCL